MKISVPHGWIWDYQVCKWIQDWLLTRNNHTTPEGWSPTSISILTASNRTDTSCGVSTVSIDTYSYPSLELMESMERENISYSYSDDLSIFIHGINICKILERMRTPSIIITNIDGSNHPRYFGLANHVGVITNLPTICISRELNYGRVDGDDIVVNEIVYDVPEEAINTFEEFDIPIPGPKRYGGVVGKVIDGRYCTLGHMFSMGDMIKLSKYLIRYEVV